MKGVSARWRKACAPRMRLPRNTWNASGSVTPPARSTSGLASAAAMNCRSRLSSALVARVRSKPRPREPCAKIPNDNLTRQSEIERHLFAANAFKPDRTQSASFPKDRRRRSRAAAVLVQHRSPGKSPQQLCVHTSKSHGAVNPSVKAEQSSSICSLMAL